MKKASSIESVRRKAFAHSFAYVDLDRALPERVFSSEVSNFSFFESDFIFAPDFVELVSGLLRIEGARSCCLLNVARSKSIDYEHAEMIFIDSDMDANRFFERLKEGGASNGWLYDIGRFCCSSDVGEWAIYCERAEDLAVFAVRDGEESAAYDSVLEKVHAQKVGGTGDARWRVEHLFSRILPEWQDKLLENYGNPG